MTRLEDRLRADLPALAELLLGGRPPSEPSVASRDRTVAPGEDLGSRKDGLDRRRLALRAAAVLVALVVAITGALTLGDLVSDDDPEVMTTTSGDAGTWKEMAVAPMVARAYPVSAWTGSEVILWAGSNLGRGMAYADGAAYDPATNSWHGLPVPGWGHPGLASAFDGRQLFVVAKESGARYDTRTRTWTSLPSVGLSFLSHVVVADGTVWALGPTVSVPVSEARLGIVRYDPEAGRWVPGPTLDSFLEPGESVIGPTLLDRHVLWTGSRIVLWAREGGGPAFDPVAGTWDRLAPPEPPSGSVVASTAVMTEDGLVALVEVEDGPRTYTATVSLTSRGWVWRATELPVQGVDRVTLAAAGRWLAIFGPGQPPTTLHLTTQEWVVHLEGPLGGLEAPAAVWTGGQLVVWGGVASPSLTVEHPVVGAVWTPPAGT